MNKTLLLTLAALALCSCNPTAEKAQLTLDIDNMNFGWDTEYDSLTHHIDFTNPWGGRGWFYGDEDDQNTYTDASDYDLVVVELSDIKGPVDKLNLCVRYTNTLEESRDLSTIVNGNTTFRVRLNDERKDQIKGIYLLADTMCEMTIQKAYFDNIHQYGEPKELKMSNIGMISADQFEGFSDKAIVKMTFETKGELQGINKYGEMVDMKGWGIGIICSAADILGIELPSRCIILRNLGVQTYTCELGDIRYLLSLKDDDGECGIYWTVWAVGGVTEANIISTTISEAID